MIKPILTVIFTLFILSLFSQTVDLQKAELVAKNMYKQQYSSSSKNLDNIGVINHKVFSHSNIPTLFVFNIEEGGFVIVSADERIKPVLGFSDKGNFDFQNLSCCLEWMIEQYNQQIYTVKNDNFYNTPSFSDEWALYSDSHYQITPHAKSTVSPLVTTTWSQGCYYNAMCPADSSLGTTRCGRVPTGCVATAFAQLLKYHNFPPQGVGSNSYQSSNYGTISANFGATTYNWNAMPVKLTSDNQAAATLLFHAGVSINMNYGPNGSSANTGNIRKALVNNFKYASSAEIIQKSSYSDLQWVNKIKGELNANRVVVLSGQDPNAGAGHAFLCDGYQNNDYFHINWGWNGSSDGYFYLNALSPSSYAFNTSVRAIVGIRPSVVSSGCSGTQTFTATSGNISDGSGGSNYGNNLDCKWLIKPTGQGTITLSFVSFETENNFDWVKVYDGETTSAPLLGTFSGSILPLPITSSSNKMLIHFKTDASQTKSGWTAQYVLNPVSSFCNSLTTLTASNGTFSDGSGSKDYSNNSDCKWLIAPSNGNSIIKLDFTSFKTEVQHDWIKIYDGETTSAPLLGTYSGNNKPPQLIATSGKMLVHFKTNGTNTKDGWSAKYTSTKSFCSGTSTRTAASGTITDGSGSLPYASNSNCKWSIKPTNASAVVLTFTAFDTEQGSDFVKVYNGSTTSSPLLGSFSGSTLPPQLTANSGKMLIHFTSNGVIEKQGFTATYTKISKENTGFEESFLFDEVLIIPNPNDGVFTVKMPDDLDIQNIVIYDLIGRIVFEQNRPINTELTFDLSLSNGIYNIIFDTPNNRFSKKLVIANN